MKHLVSQNKLYLLWALNYLGTLASWHVSKKHWCAASFQECYDTIIIIIRKYYWHSVYWIWQAFLLETTLSHSVLLKISNALLIQPIIW